MSDERNKALIRRFYEELWNEKNIGLAAELLAENVLFRGALDVESNGAEAFLEYTEMVFSAFPDFRNAIDFMVAEDDTVAVRLTCIGTHEGEIFGLKPTGRKITHRAAAFFTLEHGRIAEVWMLGDLVSMLDQLMIADAASDEEDEDAEEE